MGRAGKEVLYSDSAIQLEGDKFVDLPNMTTKRKDHACLVADIDGVKVKDNLVSNGSWKKICFDLWWWWPLKD